VPQSLRQKASGNCLTLSGPRPSQLHSTFSSSIPLCLPHPRADSLWHFSFGQNGFAMFRSRMKAAVGNRRLLCPFDWILSIFCYSDSFASTKSAKKGWNN
jgi:hypothetical protein